jgi:hypothetical protein
MCDDDDTSLAETSLAERWCVVGHLARGAAIEQPDVVRSIHDWLGDQSARSIIDYLGAKPDATRTVFEWLIKHSQTKDSAA